MKAKSIKELAGKMIDDATIENDGDVCILALSLSDGTTFSLELWSQKPKMKLNILPADEGDPVSIKLLDKKLRAKG